MESNMPDTSATVRWAHRVNHGVSWGAVVAGAIGAAVLTYALVILGFGLGLSAVSPWEGAGTTTSKMVIATALWLAFTQIAASGLGGYLAGRLRARWAGLHEDEVYFRDTAHGFLSWALASLLIAAFLASSISAVVGSAAQATGTAVSGAAQGVGGAAQKAVEKNWGDSSAYFTDSLFRTDTAATTDPASVENRAEAGRILTNSLGTGSLSAADKQYLGQIVAKKTGLSQADAEQRVDSSFNNMRQAAQTTKDKAQQVADDARKAASHAALWLFVSLFCGAFSASLAALYGGRIRETLVWTDA
jgi:hypothetical protein